MSALWKDVRIAARVLARSPGFSLVSVLTVGIAIGAIAAIFTVVNGVILRPLPYANAEELYTFGLQAIRAGTGDLPLSGTGYWHFRNKNRGFADMGGHVTQIVPLIGDGEPEQVDVTIATASFFSTLGVAPMLGRTFTPEEDVPGGPQVVVLSHALWTSRFGADREILGKTINLNAVPREVIGVMPEDFVFPSPQTDIWVPLRLDPATQNFGGHFLTPVVRLRPGQTAESMEAELKELIGRLSEAGYGPTWFTGVFSGGATVTGLRASIIGRSERPLFIVFGALGFVFLIACSNIANLFLVRARTRTRETAVRLAMGATRGQIIQYTLAETTLISLAAGVVGVLLALAGTRVLLALQPAAIPRLEEVGVNLTVLAFVALISLSASVLLGILPALRAGGVQVAVALREGGRSATAGRESHIVRGVLVATQVALAVILLVGAGLMVRSAQALRRVDAGFDPHSVLSFAVSLPPAAYAPGDRTATFFHDLNEAIRRLPNVVASGATQGLPLFEQGAYITAAIEDRPLGPNEFPPTFHVRRVTPGYFEAMGIPLQDGRLFDASDHQAHLGTAIVSASVHAKFWPNGSPIDRRVQTGMSASFSRIVGVVGDVRQIALDEPFDDFIYLPMVDSAGGGTTRMSYVVRTSGDPLALIPAVRAEVKRMDPNVPITNLRLLENGVAESIADRSFTMLLLAIAAGIALVLGCVGIYGLISYVVGERTSEIGIRMSLGAAPSGVMSLFLRQAWILAGAGIAAGLTVCILATRLLSSLLFGVSPFDPITWIFAPAVFLIVATVACLIPAGRAAAVDPAIAMRRS